MMLFLSMPGIPLRLPRQPDCQPELPYAMVQHKQACPFWWACLFSQDGWMGESTKQGGESASGPISDGIYPLGVGPGAGV